MKILHRIRGKTGKRCLSFVLAFAMLFALLPNITISAEAASSGIISWEYNFAEDGRIHVWGSGIPQKVGSSIGALALEVYYDNAADGSSGALFYSQRGAVEWKDETKKDIFKFDVTFYAEYVGTQSINVHIVDRTSGARYDHQIEFPITTTETNLNPNPSAPRADYVYSLTPIKDGFNYSVYTGLSQGRPITNYKVLWSTDGINFTGSKLVTDRPRSTVNGTVAGLVNGRKCTVKFQATNAIGTTESTTYEVTPGAPSAPTNLQTIPGNNSVLFTWSPPADMRGGILQGYEILYGDGNRKVIDTVDASTTSYNLSCTNGVAADLYFVRAKVSYGSGAMAQFPAIKAGTPYIAQTPSITKTKNTRNFTISASAKNNGANITNYSIYRNGVLASTIPGSSLNKTYNWADLGMADNTTYNIRVSATNERGEGPLSPIYQLATDGPPAKPTLSSAEATKVTGQVKLTWTTPANNGGAITEVQVLQNGTAVKTLSAAKTPNEWQAGKMDTPGQVCTYFVTGLNDGTSYSFQVRAVNAYGQGTLSDAKSAAPYRIPDAPGGLKVTRGVQSLTLNWSAAANGGNAVSKYNVSETNFLDAVS